MMAALLRHPIAVHIVIGAQKFMRKSRGHFVFWQSASRRRAEAAL
jgi:hypothetical protein